MGSALTVQPVVLAAGKGTRMGQVEIPKVLFTVNGEPMIVKLLEQLQKVPNLLTPIIVVGYKYELVQARLGASFIYAFQEGQLGTGHAVKAAKRQSTGKDILILYGDMPFIKTESLKKLIDKHIQQESIFSMFTTKAPDFEGNFSPLNSYGRIIRKGKRIEKIVEYADATVEERKITEVNPGVYLIEAQWLWENLETIKTDNKQKELYLTDLVAIARKKRIPIKTMEIDPLEVFGINTKAQLKQAEEITA